MKNADPMARLGDFDNAAELDRMLAVSPTFVARRDTMLMNDEPLRCRTGTPKFIARSPAVGRMLVADNTFRKMPELPSHLVDRYTQVYANDTSGLRTFSDVGTTRHGGVYTEEMAEKHYRDRTLRVKEFEHRPRHDAESVFWCIVVFLLLAAPLGSPPEKPHELEDPDEFGLNCAWKYIANHQIGVRKDIGDSRLSLLRDAEWDEWLHPELADVEPFLLALAAQITPEWGLIEPAPPILHLHEAMQRILLQYIDLWKTQKKDVKFDTGRIRPAEIPDNRVMPQVAHEPSVDGQHIASASLRPKRQANQLGAKEESQPKSRSYSLSFVTLSDHSSISRAPNNEAGHIVIHRGYINIQRGDNIIQERRPPKPPAIATLVRGPSNNEADHKITQQGHRFLQGCWPSEPSAIAALVDWFRDNEADFKSIQRERRITEGYRTSEPTTLATLVHGPSASPRIFIR
ncbi:hypothetical protein PTI98_009281 [Pleurotus ostreatus]|nr:hypothetical protein PTI98_009281 [Pleurotus ostreatus]